MFELSKRDIKLFSKGTALTEDFLAEIGRITVQFALLERDMIELTHRLLGLEENLARTVTAELSFRGLQNLSSSLVKERYPAKFNEFREILKCVGNSEAKRNAISHSRWGISTCRTRNERVTVRTKYSAKQSRGLDFSREEMTIQDLRAISEEISIAAYDVEVFCSSLNRSDSTDG